MTLLDSLRRRGFVLALSDDRSKILVTPASKLTPADRQALKESREDVLAALDVWPEPYGVEPEWNEGSVVLQELAILTLPGCPPVAMEAARWEKLKAELAAHNAAARERWHKRHRGE